MLIDKGLELNIKDQNGKTAFSICFEENNTPILDVFLSKISLNDDPTIFFSF